MDFGASWTAENNWQGDYNPSNTGITLTHPERGNQNYTPGSLNVTYSNTTTAAHLLVQKPTGEYVIANWHEVLMDGTQTSQTSATDTITFGQTFATVQVYDVETGTTPITTLSNVSSYTLTMKPCDMYLLVLTPAAVTDLIPDGTYIIGNRSNGNIASMATANIGAGIMQGSAGSLDTTWTVTNLGNNVVKITNVGVGGVMGCSSVVVNGGLVAQTDTGVTSQQWTVTHPAPGWFTLTSKAGAFVVDIYSGFGRRLASHFEVEFAQEVQVCESFGSCGSASRVSSS